MPSGSSPSSHSVMKNVNIPTAQKITSAKVLNVFCNCGFSEEMRLFVGGRAKYEGFAAVNVNFVHQR